MAHLIELVRPDLRVLIIAVVLDLLLGDPVYPLHPIRLIGACLSRMEAVLRRIGAVGYGGGILLFLILSGLSITAVVVGVIAAGTLHPWAGFALQIFLVYSFLALGDLLQHVWRVEREVVKGNLGGARQRISALVGRDTDRMDDAACRRAAIESLSENLTDGYTSPLAWYLVGGLSGLVLFKVVSTMDSMVGYKTPRYLEFGWCGARLDDVMNFLPARLTWLLISGVATFVPGCSGPKAFHVGLDQHAILLGPNSGWSETATAGAIQRRLVGPIWNSGQMVTDVWIGDPDDPPASTHDDVRRAVRLVTMTGLTAAAIGAGLLLAW